MAEQLPAIGYLHSIVYHNRDFGTGRFTTNNIENLWSRMKRLRAYKNGFHPRNDKELEDYALYFYWLLKHRSVSWKNWSFDRNT
ncbi:unnamed protein product [Blepharisma stoltei]|uniref:Transposase n=1 Tax=Blepharisma stoltei TaxID=1481888 RepID=A0AAU9JD95_9CILI|nr:unnamed protein product [Blepharisma stoltei]